MPELPDSAPAVTFGGYQGDGGNMTFTFGGLEAEVARLRATLAEARTAVTTFRSHYAATLDDQAADVICAVLQVLDRVPPPPQERSDEKGAGRPRITVDLNVRVRKHETYSGFEDVTGADPATLHWGDRVLAVEVESRICSDAIVTGIDPERRLVYLVPDWHGWCDQPAPEEPTQGETR